MTELSRSKESMAPRDFSNVAKRFVAKYTGHFPPEVGSVAEGMQTVDRKLRAGSGNLVYVDYSMSQKKYSITDISVIGRTDGEGLRVVKDPDSGREQISFGKDAVRFESGIETHTVSPQREVIIPEGASLELFTGSDNHRKPFLIGDEELKEEIHQSLPDAADFAFMLEQVGVSPKRFFAEYLDTERLPFSREEAEDKISEKVVAHLEAYEVPAPPVTVFPLVLQDESVFVKKGDELVNIAMQVAPEVSLDDFSNILYETKSALTQDPYSHMKRADEAYYLSWEGDRHIPRGAEMHGMKVSYSGGFSILNKQGKVMGTYRTVVESGGENGRKQEMIVFMNKFQFPENRNPKQQ